MSILDSGTRLHTVHTPEIIPCAVAADAVIKYHGLAFRDGDGLLVAADPDVAGLSFAGVALKALDNTGGDDGVIPGGNNFAAERVVNVDTAGLWDFEVNGAAPTAGEPAYLFDDETVSATTQGEGYVVGRFEYPGTAGWFVNIKEAT